jgi:hypothetical protein
MMRVFECSKSRNILDLPIDVSTLYLIAAPKTPEPVKREIIQRAEKGEPMTHAKAVAVLGSYKQRAERKAGFLLRETKKNGTRTNSRRNHKAESERPIPPKQLKDLGISLDQSSQWQQLADIPSEEFKDAIHTSAQGSENYAARRRTLGLLACRDPSYTSQGDGLVAGHLHPKLQLTAERFDETAHRRDMQIRAALDLGNLFLRYIQFLCQLRLRDRPRLAQLLQCHLLGDDLL